MIALHRAANNGHSSVVRLLLEKGANLSVADYTGQTVMKLAVVNGQEGTIHLLENVLHGQTAHGIGAYFHG